MNTKIKIVSMVIVLSLFVLSACATRSPRSLPTTATSEPANIANPASANCEQKGGNLEIRKATDGSSSGVCVFPDGSECEEWAFFRDECAPGSKMPSAPATRDETQTEAVAMVRNQLASQLKVEASALELVSVQTIDWPDACLGIPELGETCAQEITPGFRITFSSAGQDYTYHTDLSASLIRQESGPAQ